MSRPAVLSIFISTFLAFAAGTAAAPRAQAMGHRPPAPAGTVAANRTIITPGVDESCHPAKLYRPPALFTEETGRLIPRIRAAAQAAAPWRNLLASAKQFALENHPFGRAYADLSVTGERAYFHFRSLHAQGKLSEEALAAELRSDPDLDWIPQATLFRAAGESLNRAYGVAQVLAAGGLAQDRDDYDWIAVSGEDDSPYRPVNVPSAPFAQQDLRVRVGNHVVRTRYVIMEALAKPKPAVMTMNTHDRALPRVERPSLAADARVLLYVHGMDSRLEEALDLQRALRQIALETGENWTLISMDLPSAGYADKLDPQSVSDVGVIGHKRHFPPGFNARGTHRVPVVDFMESFVPAFVDALEEVIPVKARIQAVLGGSLGGNLTLRLGRRVDLPWVRNVVSWSPASIWGSLADGADIFKQIGVATAWERAGGDPTRLEETLDRRAQFFDEAFGGTVAIGPIVIVPSQPEHWWRRGWPCFVDALAASRFEREETYTRNFRLWHWRLAVEQIVYSHQGAPDLPQPLYLQNGTRMLLAAGEEDDFNFTNLFTATWKTAERMVNTPGRAVFFRNTGHSIHNERPNAFAQEIVQFLR
ncbi:MAG: hypothetical protein IT285_07470 [Bdellovibrionales bacterium]|nr:hypothetical protein [Bdellovibrionales bacterium]